ncbi:MAG: response regulator [Spirochaetales bacterium]|nr:response regulator [Spirochaetales bacterium]
MKFTFLKTILFSVLLFVILCQCVQKNIEEPAAKNGILDARDWDFRNNGSIELAGEWKFLWHENISQEKAASIPEATTAENWEIFKVPGVWNKRGLDRFGYGWFALELLTNKIPGEKLGLYLSNIYTSCEIYVDDELLIEYGKAGNTKEETIEDFVPYVMELPQKEQLIIKWKVSNFHYTFGGPGQTPKIGLLRELRHNHSFTHFRQTMLLGIMLIISIYHFALWFERREDKGSLYFALFCFVIFSRTLSINHFINLFSEEPLAIIAEISYKLNFFSFTLGPLFFISFFRKLFPRDFNKTITNIIFFLCITGTAVTACTTSDFFTPFLYFYILFLSSVCIWIIVSLIIAVIKKREGAIIMLLGFIFFFIAVIHDTLYALKIIYTGRITDIAMVIFIFLQSRTLAYRYARAYKTAKYLSQNLRIEVDKKTSELKMREEELVKSNNKLQKMDQFKTTFFQNITHELQTPLTLIMSPIDTLIKGMWGKIPQAAIKQLTLIKNQSRRLLNLINQLLDLTRLDLGKETLKATLTDMNYFLATIFSQFEYLAETKKITFQLKKPSRSLSLYIDREKLRKAFINLLSNAFKFTQNGGSITMELTSRVPQTDEKDDTTWIDISVKDTGIGIPTTELTSIFGRFHQVDGSYTRKTGGTGIGLSLVKEYVHLHHGTIDVSSTPGKGSTFRVSLQMGKKHLTSDEIAPEAPLSARAEFLPDFHVYSEEEIKSFTISQNISLLIIEDNDDLRRYLMELLVSYYSVYEAPDGQKGFEKAVEILPDLIICDIMMPEMDGLTLIEKLQEIKVTENIPFIFLTAKKGLNDRIKGLKKGALDYITKPFEVEELVAKIESLLRNREKYRKAHINEMEDRLLKTLETNNIQEEENNKKPFPLTKTEMQLIEALKEGKTYQEIADEEFISVSAIKKRMAKIYTKCGVQNKTELLALFVHKNN